MIHGERVVDAHQHFWELGPGRYSWLTPDAGDLHDSFGVDDVEPLVAASGVDDVVLVQADPTFDDTDAMLAVADTWHRVVGVVAWAPLDQPAALEAALGRYGDDPRVVGLRHQIHDEPDRDWVVRPAVLDGLRRLADHDLPYDVVAVDPRHLEHVPTLATEVPGLRLVIDHLAKPPVPARDPDGFATWRAALTHAAEHDQVTAKISGLDTTVGPGYSASDLRPCVEHALEVFGPDRLMFGSDWPVSTLAGGYTPWWETALELLGSLTAGEQVAVLGGTARACYGLPLGSDRPEVTA